MPAPATNAELFALIAKSGVLDDVRVKAYLDKLTQGDGVPTDPIALGGRMVLDGLLTHFQAEQLLQGRWKRFSIGKYKVLERLGVGGMGQVFLCEHKLMKRKVAVKVLPAAKSKDEAALQRFYREARAVAAVDHPNIVRAYDIDDDDDLHFLVMEYVDGANLHDLVRKGGPMPPLRACHYVYGAAVGLQHAHEMGLVHRDIKPANILVDRAGVVKILDMGLARFFHPDEDDHLTKKFEENVLGTADYLAPEQAMDSTTVDIRADIYGLGGTFQFMLTGQPPFPDGTVAQKLLWHQSKPPKPISDYRQDVPAPLLAVVAKMLAKDPAARYQTPAEVMAALAPWVQTPIAPPSETELPTLSVAAGGRPTGSEPTVGGSAAPLTPATLPVARPMSTLPTPAVTSASNVVPERSDNPWADLTAAETTPSAQDTARTRRDRDADRPRKALSSARSGKKARPRDDDVTPPKKGPPVLLWVLLAAVGLVGLLGGVGVVLAVIFLGGKRNTAPSAVTSPIDGKRVWYVAKSGVGPNPATTRNTLQQALRDAKAGEEVTILDDTIEITPITLADYKNIRISTSGKTVTVTCKSGDAKGAGAVLHLRGCENVVLSGLVIDAGGQHDIGVQVSGGANGVTLERVTVRNARKHAVNLLNVTAAAAQPLTLSQCRLLVGGGQSGIHLSGSAELACRGVRINDCRFEGVGAGSGVRVEGASEDVLLRNNRFYNLDAGVLFHLDSLVPKVCQMAIERNTFHTTKTGVRVDQPAAVGREVRVTGNYFAGGGMAVAPSPPPHSPAPTKAPVPPVGVQVVGNGRDALTQAALPGIDAVSGVTLLAPPPDAPDDKFLRLPAKLLLNNNPIGAE
ncbi:MAG: protein kinase [Fimbriiglobus sp.]|jgi:serine/threonine protein kinase|nr:protein kinase [Fimbriiglobus sp.]